MRAVERRKPWRRERLDAIAEHPNGPERLPHRLLERVLRRRHLTTAVIAPILRRTSPGQVIIANLPNRLGFSRVQGSELSFPETDITDQAVLSARVVGSELIGPPGSLSLAARKSEKSKDAVLSPWQNALRAHRIEALGMLTWTAAVLCGLWSLDWDIGRAAVMLGIWILAFSVFIVRLVEHRSWFLIPGALICYDVRLLGARNEPTRFTASDTPLFLDARAKRGYLVHGDAVLGFDCPLPWVVASSWFSPTPPSDVE